MKISFRNSALFLVIIIGIFLEVWKINQFPIEQWDEARRGINALGMIHGNDYFNYSFVDQPDTFNTKPPLTIWLIAASFKFFGISNFSLRFHSIISIILFLYFFSRLILLYRDKVFAALAIGMIISVKGVIGFHVGRTGDTDSVLLLFLTAFLYYFLSYWDFGRKWAIFPAGLFFGLAFCTKSFAAFLVIPGVLVYMLLTDRKKILSKEILAGGLFAFLIIAGWTLFTMNGSRGTGTDQNMFQTMFNTDLVRRFTDNSFEAGFDLFYVFHVLDMSFNIWNYLLYLAGFIALLRIIWFKKTARLKQNKLVLLSLLIAAGYAIILSLSMNKHRWYLAPAIPFFAILTTEFIYSHKDRYSWVLPAFLILFASLIIRKFVELNKPDQSVSVFFRDHSELLHQAGQLLVDKNVSQDLVYEFVKYGYTKARLVDGLPENQSGFVYFGPQPGSDTLQIRYKLNGNHLVTSDAEKILND